MSQQSNDSSPLRLLQSPAAPVDTETLAQDGKNRLLFLSHDINLARYVPEAFGGAEEVVFVHDEAQIEPTLEERQFRVIVVAMPVSHEVMVRLRTRMTLGSAHWILAGELNKPMHMHLKSLAFAVLSAPMHLTDLESLCVGAFAQTRLQQANTNLQRNLAQSTTMLEVSMRHSKDMMYALNEKGDFSYASEHLEPFLGLPRGSLIGQHYSAIIDSADKELADYVFACRRSNLNSHHDVELRLKSQSKKLTEHKPSVNVLLSTAGIYDEPEAEGEAEAEGEVVPSNRVFRGMYGIFRELQQPTESLYPSPVQQRAYLDVLTGLPNRALLTDRLNIALAQAKRQHRVLALMFLDLEKFKKVNDTFGHPFGDQVLRVVASRLKSCLRNGDTLARYGGDEFVALLPEVPSQEAASAIARKITRTFSEPIVLEEKEISIGASIGIALYPNRALYSNEEDDAEAIIRYADLAMYHAKNTPRRKYSIYNEKMTQSAAQNRQIEVELREAISEGQIEVLYRPLVSLTSGRAVSTETNIRWMHPKRGLMPYESFWSVAKKTGLIADINEQAHAQAYSQFLAWRRQGLSDFKLSLKLSSAEVWQNNFPKNFLDIMKKSGVDPEAIELEIEEETVLQDIDMLAPRLRRIGRTGASLAISQFGGGYFSLFHLHRFPINSLRIDRAFTDEISGHADQPIISGIVAMAKALNIQVAAEGVETRQQLTYLRNIGCNMVSGSFFGPPLKAEAMVDLLQNGRALF